MDALCIKTTHYFIGGLSLVTALAWNSSIRAAVETYFPIPNKLMAGVIYAVTITCLLMLVIYLLPETDTELPQKVQEHLKNIGDRPRSQAPIIHAGYLPDFGRH